MPYASDKELAAAIARGKQAAFDEFFNTYFSRLFRFCLRRLDEDEAMTKDIVQEALIKAIRKIQTYRGEASLFTWLCQICRSEISAHFRKVENSSRIVPLDDRPELRSILESLEGGDDNPDVRLQRAQLTRLIQTTLDYLPGRYGDIIEWKYLEELSVDEIASRLGTSFAAAQSALARARRAFQAAVADVLPAYRAEESP